MATHEISEVHEFALEIRKLAMDRGVSPILLMNACLNAGFQYAYHYQIPISAVTDMGERIYAGLCDDN